MADTQYGTTFPAIPRANGIAKIVVGASTKGADATRVAFHTKDEIKAAVGGGAAGADAEREAVTVTYAGGQRVLLASVGKKASVEGVRKSAVAAVGKARALKVTALEFALPAVEGASAARVVEALVQAAALSNYSFDRYLTTEEKVPTLLAEIAVTGVEGAEAEAAAKTAATLADCTIFARDLANERADEMHPGRLEAVAEAISKETGAALFVVRGDDLVKHGLHMFAAVGQAARHAPRYIELLHKGDPAHPEDIVMVLGKGITFDSGGLNIKGTGFMEDMHMDMSGSAAALGSALAAGRLGIKRNVLFVAAAAENAIDALAYKPHAIIKSHKGLTVEIGNTDAEGRLVLADALSFAQARHRPHTVVDMATLTGACIVGLGEYAAGLFTNNKALREGLVAAGEGRGERLWPMPILPEHRDELSNGTPFADLKSTGEGRYGGACTAAAFLENFLGPDPAKNAREGAPAAADEGTKPFKPAWAHIDLAGPAMYSRDRGFMKKGGTGFGVHAVVSYLLAAPAGPLPADA